MSALRTILSENRLIPVLVIERPEDTAPMCEAILAGGLRVVEITLRTPAALDCISGAVKRFPDLAVGAGTVTTPEQVMQVVDAGAAFGVSPGTTDALREAVSQHELPFLPGGSTPSEFLGNADAGFMLQKFFPAETSGGAALLKSLVSPLPDISFCPTGGLHAGNVGDYLSLPNVIAAGGSWFVAADKIRQRDWPGITNAVRMAVAALNGGAPA